MRKWTRNRVGECREHGWHGHGWHGQAQGRYSGPELARGEGWSPPEAPRTLRKRIDRPILSTTSFRLAFLVGLTLWGLVLAADQPVTPAVPQTRPAARKTAHAEAARTYRNPIINCIGPADPAVIRYEGKYYLYPTLDGRGYDVFVSDDLVHWQQRPKCFTDRRRGVWAPDVFYNQAGDRNFYLYYTVDKPGGGKLVGVATSTSPLGPFKDKGTLVENAIDAHLFRDDDGALYLYYCDLSAGFNRIAVRTMKDLLTTQGEPRVLISPTDKWERHGGPVAEGPWMLKHKGVYYLMYSGSGANTPDYAIGYATAKSPRGPFTKYPGNPIAHRGNGVFGPGHHCVVAGPDDKLWMVYHQQNSERICWDRFLAIDPLWFDDAGVIHVKTTRGTDQPAPEAINPKLTHGRHDATRSARFLP